MSALGQQSAPATQQSAPEPSTSWAPATDFGSNDAAQGQLEGEGEADASGVPSNEELEDIADLIDTGLANQIAESTALVEGSIANADVQLRIFGESPLVAQLWARRDGAQTLTDGVDVVLQELVYAVAPGEAVPEEDVELLWTLTGQLDDAARVLDLEAETVRWLVTLQLEPLAPALEAFVEDLADAQARFEGLWDAVTGMEALVRDLEERLAAHGEEAREILQGMALDAVIDGFLAASGVGVVASVLIGVGLDLGEQVLLGEGIDELGTIDSGAKSFIGGASDLEGIDETLGNVAGHFDAAFGWMDQAEQALLVLDAAEDVWALQTLRGEMRARQAELAELRSLYAVSLVALEPLRSLVNGLLTQLPKARPEIDRCQAEIRALDPDGQLYEIPV